MATGTVKKTRGRPPSAQATTRGASVQSLDRALALLEIIAAEDGLSLSNISQRAGLPPSTAHRILTTLQLHGFVSLDEDRGVWLVGIKAFLVGNGFLRHRKIAGISRNALRQLMESTGETANLGIEESGSVVFISQVECHKPIRAFHRPGSRSSLHASSIGKALLAARSNEDIRKVLQHTGLEQLTPKTLCDPDALFLELDRIREQGWSVDDEEANLGMRCVASAIFNEFGEAIAGVSISGPTERLSPARIGELGPMIKRTADGITAAFGGQRKR